MKIEVIYGKVWRMPDFFEFKDKQTFGLWDFINQHIYDYKTHQSRNVAFDIGGVLSKYPELFLGAIKYEKQSQGNIDNVYIITDMHKPEQTLDMLTRNGFMDYLKKDNIINADFEKYGEACKKVELEKHNICMFFDDFPAYVSDGCPIKCRVLPDLTKPYYADSWQTDGSEGSFGRRRTINEH